MATMADAAIGAKDKEQAGKGVQFVHLRVHSAFSLLEGALPIKRLAFNVGEGDWKDTSMVADEVVIKFHIVTAH